jgi:hypothetical protein
MPFADQSVQADDAGGVGQWAARTYIGTVVSEWLARREQQWLPLPFRGAKLCALVQFDMLFERSPGCFRPRLRLFCGLTQAAIVPIRHRTRIASEHHNSLGI